MFLMSEPVSEPEFDARSFFRSTEAADAALKNVVHKVKASKRVGWRKPGKVTQEAIFNAVWLWLDDIDPEVVISAMETYVPRLRAMMTGEASPETTGRGDEDESTDDETIESSGEGIPSTKKKPRNNAG